MGMCSKGKEEINFFLYMKLEWKELFCCFKVQGSDETNKRKLHKIRKKESFAMSERRW